MREEVVVLNNLSKFIQSKAIVLRMSLNIPRGSLFGLLGPNGAGKTTTLKLMTGRLKPTSGSISILGMDPWKDRVKLFKKIGYLPQNPSLHPDKTVFKFLKYMAQLKGYNKHDAVIEVRDILNQVGLAKFEQSIVGKLSGGETQRLGFANALIGNPEVLLLDEPTASLDPEGRVYVMQLISDLARDHNQTIVISSHILPELKRMVDHIAIMSEGRVLVSGAMRDLTRNIYDDTYEITTDKPELMKQDLIDLGYEISSDRSTDALIVSSNGRLENMWLDIPRICQEKGYALKEFKPVRDALENVFLNLVSNRFEDKAQGDISNGE